MRFYGLFPPDCNPRRVFFSRSTSLQGYLFTLPGSVSSRVWSDIVFLERREEKVLFFPAIGGCQGEALCGVHDSSGITSPSNAGSLFLYCFFRRKSLLPLSLLFLHLLLRFTVVYPLYVGRGPVPLTPSFPRLTAPPKRPPSSSEF